MELGRYASSASTWGKIGGVDEQEAGSRTHQGGDQHEQTEQNAADELASADFDRREIFVERLHRRSRSG